MQDLDFNAALSIFVVLTEASERSGLAESSWG